jgi:hypothetical protein
MFGLYNRCKIFNSDHGLKRKKIDKPNSSDGIYLLLQFATACLKKNFRLPLKRKQCFLLLSAWQRVFLGNGKEEGK